MRWPAVYPVYIPVYTARRTICQAGENGCVRSFPFSSSTGTTPYLSLTYRMHKLHTGISVIRSTLFFLQLVSNCYRTHAEKKNFYLVIVCFFLYFESMRFYLAMRNIFQYLDYKWGVYYTSVSLVYPWPFATHRALASSASRCMRFCEDFRHARLA